MHNVHAAPKTQMRPVMSQPSISDDDEVPGTSDRETPPLSRPRATLTRQTSVSGVATSAGNINMHMTAQTAVLRVSAAIVPTVYTPPEAAVSNVFPNTGTSASTMLRTRQKSIVFATGTEAVASFRLDIAIKQPRVPVAIANTVSPPQDAPHQYGFFSLAYANCTNEMKGTRIEYSFHKPPPCLQVQCRLE